MEYDGNHLVNATDSVSSGPTWQGVFHFVGGEEAEAGEDEYEYDVNGNMTKDLNRNISLVQYNSLNLPKKITFANNMGDISYTYSSTGEKLSVGYLYGAGPIIGPILPSTAFVGEGDTPQDISSGQTPRDGGGLINMDDLYSISYCGNVVYDHGVVRLLTDEGYVTFSTDGTPTYHFYVRDHLGNVRVVFDEDWDTEQVTHYYPFGGIMAESSGQSVQPWKYGGKELDRTHGLDAYDFGARTYFADRMQWGQMDPLCEKYYSISPYAYCLDNPIMCIDPDGRNIYMLFYTVGNKDEEADRMFKAAAETRKQDIMKSKEFDSSKDIVILSSISNLGSLGDIVNNIIDTYSEKYGKTAEFGFWSHSAFDGPAGTKTTSLDLTGNNQMSIEGWGKINFNWEENASAYFYGCRSGVPSKSGVSFTTNLSGQENFHNVSIYGQTSYSYPSKYTNIRETATNMLFGHFSYPTYMVGGYKKNGHLAYLSIIPALPMRRSVNGKEDLNKIYYQPGRKF